MQLLQYKKKLIISVLVFGLALWFLGCLPNPLFKDAYSVVLNDNEGKLLSAKIAQDGQWRFPKVGFKVLMSQVTE